MPWLNIYERKNGAKKIKNKNIYSLEIAQKDKLNSILLWFDTFELWFFILFWLKTKTVKPNWLYGVPSSHNQLSIPFQLK